MNENVSAWLTAIDGLPDVHQRLRPVEVRCLAAIDFIRRYDHPNACFYCDPPYIHSTRTATAAYSHEMDEADHEALLGTLANVSGSWLLSGYHCELYDQWAARHGFECHEFDVDNKASGAKTKERKIECVWRSRR